MKPQICSVLSHPSIGGIAAFSALPAERFRCAVHRVVLVTLNAAVELKRDAFRVARRLSASRLIIGQSLPMESTMVPNSYADDVFMRDDRAPQQRDLVFVGRHVSDKGVDRLVAALKRLASRGVQAVLTRVGEGLEAPALRRATDAAGIADLGRFAGWQVAADLVTTLNRQCVLVVRSVRDVPSSVVVLDGQAYDYVPLVTCSGGLPDAAGDCSLLAARDGTATLTEGIQPLLGHTGLQGDSRARASAPVRCHTSDRVERDSPEVLFDASPASAR